MLQALACHNAKCNALYHRASYQPAAKFAIVKVDSPIQPAVLDNGLPLLYSKLIRRQGRMQLQARGCYCLILFCPNNRRIIAPIVLMVIDYQ